MRLFSKTKKDGLSLKMTFIVMLVIFLTLTTVLLTTSVKTIQAFHALSHATDSYIELQNAAADLMDASDYLTDEAQCYTVTGQREHLDNYFTEAEETRRREAAVETMEQHAPDSDALGQLRDAMNDSLNLMDREYYAMALMLSAQGDTDIPAAMSGVVLSAEDQALSAEDKMALSRQMMHDDAYYAQKNSIRSHMHRCIEELIGDTHATQDKMVRETHMDLIWMIVLVVIQTISLILLLWLTTSLGINPILRAVDHIKHNQKIPIVGAHEFRYLAGTYNKMYAAYKKSIEHLSFKASHDAMTGLYNRAGYDLIVQNVDLKTTAFLLLDADRFKEINDSSGHETGDLVLKKIADTLKRNFRSDDYICRIGGDEFVVLMVHINKNYRHLIEQKIKLINRELEENRGDLPKISVSAGVSFCSDAKDAQEVFNEADIALYMVKKTRRSTVCFYETEQESN